MIYELRTYKIPPGRMDDILDRFERVTMDLFEKHSIEVVGFWTVAEPATANELVYLLKFPSLEASAAAWTAFRDDPEWQETRRRTEANGPIVEEVIEKTLIPTSFSSMK